MSSCFQYFFLKNTFKSKYGGVRVRPTSSTAVHEEHYMIYNIIQFSFLFRLALVTGPDFPCQSLQCARKELNIFEIIQGSINSLRDTEYCINNSPQLSSNRSNVYCINYHKRITFFCCVPILLVIGPHSKQCCQVMKTNIKVILK